MKILQKDKSQAVRFVGEKWGAMLRKSCKDSIEVLPMNSKR